jgi:hypothetical protein
MDHSHTSNGKCHLLRLPTELHLKIFDMRFNDLIDAGQWTIPYFAVANSLHDPTRLSRRQRYTGGIVSSKEHKATILLIVCAKNTRQL